jgi:hypothetical protein
MGLRLMVGTGRGRDGPRFGVQHSMGWRSKGGVTNCSLLGATAIRPTGLEDLICLENASGLKQSTVIAIHAIYGKARNCHIKYCMLLFFQMR